MEIVPPIQKRRARRGIAPTPLAADVRDRLVAAAALAPSFMNAQPWRFVLVEGAALQNLHPHLEPGNYWAKPAPLIVAVVSDLAWDGRMEGGRDYALFDTGMACMNLMVQAEAEGLVAHPIAGFKSAGAKAALGIPEGHVLIALIVVGRPGDASGLNERHAAAETAERQRKPIGEIAAPGAWAAALEPPAKA